MSISDTESHHGAVLARIVHQSDEPFSFEVYPTKSNSSYVFNNKIGLYIKYSKKRLSPWRFSFQKAHQDEILEMKEKLGNVYTVFVCGKDGVVGLDYRQLKQVLDEQYDEVEWVSISRTRNTKYSIAGSNGKLRLKIGKQDFPKKLFEEIRTIKGRTENKSGFFRSIFSGKTME